MTTFLQILRETALFMLGAQVLLYLGPGKKYEKYGKMIVSLLVLAQLAEPILDFGRYLGETSFHSRMEYFAQENEQFLDKLKLLEEDSQTPVWEGMVLSVEELLADLAGEYEIRMERVDYAEGKLRIEAGTLKPVSDLQKLQERISEAVTQKLDMLPGQLEVILHE